MTSKFWCFTLFAENDTTPLTPLNYEEDWETARYLVYQEEIAPSSGRHHYQGYVEFTRDKRLTGVRKILPTAHWETRRGTREEARAYCMKTESRHAGPFEHGEWKAGGRGARTDLLELYGAIKRDKLNKNEIMDLMPEMYFKFHGAIDKMIAAQQTKRDWKTKITLICGPPGSGKSHWCHETFPDAYWKSASNWWDQYNGEETVILDEFYGWLPWNDLLRLLDKYPYQVQVKGSTCQMVAKQIIITSNKHPWEWYKNDKIHWDMEALYRRIEEFWYWPKPIDGVYQEPRKYTNFTEWDQNHYSLNREF